MGSGGACSASGSSLRHRLPHPMSQRTSLPLLGAAQYSMLHAAQ